MRLALHHLTGLASLSAARAAAISAVLWLVIFVYCNYALYRDPHSAYFHSENIYDLKYSAARQIQARTLLSHYSASDNSSDPTSPPPPPALRTGPHPALCAGFATIRRPHPDAAHYFSDSIGSMLAGLSPEERAAFKLNVLFANTDPTIHPDFGAPWLSALADHAAGYERISDAERAELHRLEEDRDFQRKGVLDYIYLLDQCYRESNAPFIAVFEDDIVFDPSWLARTLVGLQHLVLPRDDGIIQAASPDDTPWLYLRLFYTETFMMWDSDDWLYEHMFLTFLVVSLGTATVLFLLRRLLRQNSDPIKANHPSACRGLGLRLDLPTIAVLSVLSAPAFTALFFMAGKYNIPMFKLHDSSVVGSNARRLADAGVFQMDKHGCCTQGLVFDRAQVPDLIARLRSLGRGQTDIMIEEYCTEKPLRRFALGDQALQHVGVISGRGSGGISLVARDVYAFFFEEKREEDVKKSQESALQSLDWGVFGPLEAHGDAGDPTRAREGLKQGLGIIRAP